MMKEADDLSDSIRYTDDTSFARAHIARVHGKKCITINTRNMGLPGGAASDIALDIRHLDGVVKSSVCQGVVTVTIDSSGRLDFDKLYNELMSAMARTCAARIVANRKVALRR